MNTRKGLELIFNEGGKNTVHPEERLSKVVEDIWKRRKSWQENEK